MAVETNITNGAENTAGNIEIKKEIVSEMKFSSRETEGNKFMAVISYIGILVFVPIIFAREEKYVRFHANQGLLLLLFDIALVILYNIFSVILLSISWKAGMALMVIGIIFGLCALFGAVYGIFMASKGEGKTLPLIGNISLLK